MKTTTRSAMGSVKQLPSGRWRARVTVGIGADGKRAVESRTFDHKRDADRWVFARSVEAGDGHVGISRVTLADWWEAYKVTRGKRLAKKTVETYDCQMRTVWLPAYGDTDIGQITPPMVQATLLNLTREKARHAKTALSAVLSAATTCNPPILMTNPLLGVRFEMPYDTGVAYEDESVWDADPFAVIEGTTQTWDAETVKRALPHMRGLRLEPVWLAMVGAGLRMQEAFAIRRMDVRRSEVAIDDNGTSICATQLAIHHAETATDGRKRTKTTRSVRIVTMLEPFGSRYWELAEAFDDPHRVLCDVPRGNAWHMWHGYWQLTNPATAKHRPKRNDARGDRGKLAAAGLPYIPLAKMRRSHESMMQQAHVLDSINAAMHGHSQQIAYRHYQRADETQAVIQAQRKLKLVV